MRNRNENISDKILELCKDDYLSVSKIAEKLEMSKHTIRAHYIYPMANEGLLKMKFPKGTRMGQAYKKAIK
jgi:ATP-dependent DNA helicase RecG